MIGHYFGCMSLQLECEEAITQFVRMLDLQNNKQGRMDNIIGGFALAVEKLVQYHNERMKISTTCVDNDRVGEGVRRKMMHFARANQWAFGIGSLARGQVAIPAGVAAAKRYVQFFDTCRDWCTVCAQGNRSG